MIPYVDFSYFLFLLYPLVVLIVLGGLGRLGPRAVLLISVLALVFQYANPLGSAGDLAAGLRQLRLLVAYVVLSVVVVLAFSAIRSRRQSQPIFYAAVALALLPLVAVKAFPLALQHGWLLGPYAALEGVSPFDLGLGQSPVGPLTPGLFDSFGFLGVSYLTFRVLDAIIVIHDGLVKERPGLGSLLAYLLFLPTMSAGPIDRYRRFSKDYESLPRCRGAYLRDVEAGLHRIAQGFLYKFILAYLVYRYALLPVLYTNGLLSLLRYMYAYSLYLFFDFAGYSAFAIGVGRFFGIHVPENFNAPFISRDFKDMWNRWHMTLSWWFRDHIYMRFLLNASRGKWFGGNRLIASYVGFFLTMGLMGFWHGLYLHYIVYGLYQGLMLVASDVVARWNRQRRLIADGWLAHGASVFLTVNLFCFGLLIFSGRLFQ